MENVRVEYELILKIEDGSEVTLNKEKVLLSEQGDDPQKIQSHLEKDFRETEEAELLEAMKVQLGKGIIGTTFNVTRVSKLVPAGDDDQM